jgi:hypothetical protein
LPSLGITRTPCLTFWWILHWPGSWQAGSCVKDVELAMDSFVIQLVCVHFRRNLCGTHNVQSIVFHLKLCSFKLREFVPGNSALTEAIFTTPPRFFYALMKWGQTWGSWPRPIWYLLQWGWSFVF